MNDDFARQMERIARNARAHEQAMLEATIGVLRSWGADARLYMIEHAPWTDQTGEARYGATAAAIYAVAGVPEGRGLTWTLSTPDDLRDGGRVVLITDSEHGVYLETANGSKYAILMPTVATLGPQLVAQLREIWHA